MKRRYELKATLELEIGDPEDFDTPIPENVLDLYDVAIRRIVREYLNSTMDDGLEAGLFYGENLGYGHVDCESIKLTTLRPEEPVPGHD